MSARRGVRHRRIQNWRSKAVFANNVPLPPILNSAVPDPGSAQLRKAGQFPVAALDARPRSRFGLVKKDLRSDLETYVRRRRQKTAPSRSPPLGRGVQRPLRMSEIRSTCDKCAKAVKPLAQGQGRTLVGTVIHEAAFKESNAPFKNLDSSITSPVL